MASPKSARSKPARPKPARAALKASPLKASPPKASPPKASPLKASPPKASPLKISRPRVSQRSRCRPACDTSAAPSVMEPEWWDDGDEDRSGRVEVLTMPQEIADELAAEVRARAADLSVEVIEAGFWARRETGPGARSLPPSGSGFGSGEVLDTLAPGPSLAGMTDAVTGDGDLGRLDDDELVGILRAWRRLRILERRRDAVRDRGAGAPTARRSDGARTARCIPRADERVPHRRNRRRADADRPGGECLPGSGS